MQRLVEFHLETTLRRQSIVDQHHALVVGPPVSTATQARVAPTPHTASQTDAVRDSHGRALSPVIMLGVSSTLRVANRTPHQHPASHIHEGQLAFRRLLAEPADDLV